MKAISLWLLVVSAVVILLGVAVYLNHPDKENLSPLRLQPARTTVQSGGDTKLILRDFVPSWQNDNEQTKVIVSYKWGE